MIHHRFGVLVTISFKNPYCFEMECSGKGYAATRKVACSFLMKNALSHRLKTDCHGCLPENQHTFVAQVANDKGGCAKRNALAASFARMPFST